MSKESDKAFEQPIKSLILELVNIHRGIKARCEEHYRQYDLISKDDTIEFMRKNNTDLLNLVGTAQGMAALLDAILKDESVDIDFKLIKRGS
jgi:hypothetical protein